LAVEGIIVRYAPDSRARLCTKHSERGARRPIDPPIGGTANASRPLHHLGRDLGQAVERVGQRVVHQPFRAQPEAGEDRRVDPAGRVGRDRFIAAVRREPVEVASTPSRPGVVDPVLRDADSRVLGELRLPIARHAVVGNELDHEIGRSFQPGGEDPVLVPVGHEEQVRLAGRPFPTDAHVDRRGQDRAETKVAHGEREQGHQKRRRPRAKDRGWL